MSARHNLIVRYLSVIHLASLVQIILDQSCGVYSVDPRTASRLSPGKYGKSTGGGGILIAQEWNMIAQLGYVITDIDRPAGIFRISLI